MVKVTFTATVAGAGDDTGDAKATESAAANLMAETMGDSVSDRQQQQQR